MLGLLAMCQAIPVTGTTGSKPVCLIWKDITYSGSEDSAQTVQEVRELNAKRDAYCKGK